jgi:branched-chain amino acid transport system permease protein
MNGLLSGLLVDGIATGMIYALLSLAFAVSYWPSNQFHYAFAGVFVVVVYTYWWLSSDIGIAWYLAGIAACVAGAILACLCFLLFYRYVASEFGVFLTGFGLALILQSLIQLQFGPDPKTDPMPGTLTKSFTALDATITTYQVVEVTVSLILIGGTLLFLRKARMGVAMRGLATDEYLAECVGINKVRLLIGVYTLGAVLATIAGILLVIDTGLSPAAGNQPLFYALTGVLIGGTRNYLGAALGGLLLGLLSSLAVYYFATEWQITVSFAFLLLLMVVRPQGLMGKELKAV